MLSLYSYVWKCVAGAEIVYFICLFGAFVVDRTTEATVLHQRIFETLPGFIWLNAASVILGAVYIFVFAVVFGCYMVWMHNSSLKS